MLSFVTAFDIPGLEFVPLRVSEGQRAVAFTWKVVVNGDDGPSGISFYEVDAAGKVCFIRDIPAPAPAGFRPAGQLCAAIDPELQVFSGAKLNSAALGVASEPACVLGLDILGTAVRAARATAPRRRKTRGERSGGDGALSAPRDGEEWGLEIT